MPETFEAKIMSQQIQTVLESLGWRVVQTSDLNKEIQVTARKAKPEVPELAPPPMPPVIPIPVRMEVARVPPPPEIGPPPPWPPIIPPPPPEYVRVPPLPPILPPAPIPPPTEPVILEWIEGIPRPLWEMRKKEGVPEYLIPYTFSLEELEALEKPVPIPLAPLPAVEPTPLGLAPILPPEVMKKMTIPIAWTREGTPLGLPEGYTRWLPFQKNYFIKDSDIWNALNAGRVVILDAVGNVKDVWDPETKKVYDVLGREIGFRPTSYTEPPAPLLGTSREAREAIERHLAGIRTYEEAVKEIKWVKPPSLKRAIKKQLTDLIDRLHEVVAKIINAHSILATEEQKKKLMREAQGMSELLKMKLHPMEY